MLFKILGAFLIKDLMLLFKEFQSFAPVGKRALSC